jgi:hypothetical protein
MNGSIPAMGYVEAAMYGTQSFACGRVLTVPL